MGNKLTKKDFYPYQPIVAQHIVDNPFCGLFLDMGMTKTVISLTAINTLVLEDFEIETVLVIGPRQVVESTWPDEVEKWEHLRNLKLSPIIGTPKERRAAIRKKADIYLISCDNFAWLVAEFGGGMLPYEMCVVDESSKFKNPSAVKSKVFKAIQPCFKRIVILTGTPAPNGLIDIWFQIWMLDRGQRLGAYIAHYKDRFFNYISKPGSWHGKYEPTETTKEKIYRAISDIVISMEAPDYQKHKKPRFIDVPVILPEKVKKAYDKFEREKVMELLEAEVTAMTASVMSGKLLQFAGGAVYDDEKNVHVLHDHTLDALEELVERAEGKNILIAYTFKHELARIMERLKAYKPVHFKTDQHIKDWNAGKIRIMVMHPASGGHGLNLQYGGHIAIWFSLNWSLELYLQWCARLPRPGQKWQVLIYRLIVKGTECESVVRSLDKKEVTQQGLMEAVRAKLKKYGLSYKKLK